MRLFLVRHGQSIANQQHLVTGDTTDVLSPAGIEQMRRTSDLLNRQGFRFRHCFTSQWQRAQQSARIVMPQASFIADPRLGEAHAGDVAGMALSEFLETWPDFYEDHTNRYPGGESHEDLNNRVLQWLQHMRDQCDGDVLAVTHAGPISCILQHVLHVPMKHFPALVPRNSSISIVDFPSTEAPGSLVAFSWLPESSVTELIGL